MAARRDAATAVVQVEFEGVVERLNVVDRAHRGDIEGALGTVRAFPSVRARRLRLLLAILGPGLIVMVADNDAGGVSLYAQAGQRYGDRMIWLILLLAPVLFVVQEMVVRLGAVTGAGHARLIFERFGRRWGRFAVADLLVLNLLTIVTEFIGVRFAAGYFGISRFVAIPAAAVLLVAVTVRGRFRGWERAMLLAVGASLVALPLASVALHHHANGATPIAAGPGTVHDAGLLFVMALVGTTVAPWQLFFQQSTVVDKRITSRYVGYERADTAIGTVLFALAAVGILAGCAAVLHRGSLGEPFTDAGQVAGALADSVGWWAGALFAVALLNGALLGAAAITLSTSYAISDATGLRQSLHRHWRDARAFHGSFTAVILTAASLVLIPGDPLAVVTVTVSVLASVLLPSAVVFLLLLCNDTAVLGPWTNPRWLNILATLVAGGLVTLSAALVTTTLFPALPIRIVAATFAVTAAVAIGFGAMNARRSGPTAPDTPDDWTRRDRWSMPALESLPQPDISRARVIGLVVLRAYLIGAALLVIVRAVTLLHYPR